MKYILDEDEYNALMPKKEASELIRNRDEALEILRRKIMPDHNCKELLRHAYCDNCHLSRTANRPQDSDILSLLCNRKQEYSK